MSKVCHRRRLRTTGVVLAGLLACLVLCWLLGLVGPAARWGLVRFSMPWELDDGFRVDGVEAAPDERAGDTGIYLALSTDRARAITRQAWAWWWILPPGLLRDGLVVRGSWDPEDLDLPEGRIPVVILLREEAVQPALTVRYPAESFNELVRSGQIEKIRLHDRDEYEFGHYEMFYRPTFTSFRLQSIDVSEDTPVSVRRFEYACTGRLGIKLEENILTARTEGKVKDLRGRATVEFIRDEGGLGFAYDVTIDRMDVNIKNLASFLDDVVAEKLRKSMLRSMNRRKKKERLARKRFPPWIPVDTTVDVQLSRMAPR